MLPCLNTLAFTELIIRYKLLNQLTLNDYLLSDRTAFLCVSIMFYCAMVLLSSMVGMCLFGIQH